MRLLKLLSLIGLFLLGGSAVSADSSAAVWKLEREKDGIKVFTRDVDGSKYKAFRGEAMLKAELNRAMALMDDTAACDRWMHACTSPVLIDKLNPLERFSYMVNDLPWPATDRAMLLRATISQQMDDRIVTVALESVDPASLSEKQQGRLPDSKGAVMVEKARGFFRFTPIDEHSTRVEYQMHTELGGALPAPMVNAMLVDTPFYTLKNMQSVVLEQKYQDFRPF